MFLSFFFCRNPTPGNIPVYFEPVRNNVLNYLEINNEGLFPGTDPHKENAKFWDDLLAEYNLV